MAEEKKGIVVFPLDRRWKLVEETADIVMLKKHDAAVRFWRLTVRRLAGEMQACGIATTVIDNQLLDFAAAVQRRISASGYDFPEEGDAA